jgi:AcrR family transcriptional regulator
MTGLRETKFSRTRLALATALSNALSSEPFDAVAVKQLCRQAEVSEATFFNYFPGKSDLLAYLASLWLLELAWHVRKASSSARGLAVIDALFAQAARTCERRPGVMREFLVWIARGGSGAGYQDPPELEKRLAFPDFDAIEQVAVQGIDALMMPHIEAAVADGQLPDNVLRPTLVAGLLTIFFGVPMTLLSRDPARVANMYRQQLNLLWAGARAAARGGES